MFHLATEIKEYDIPPHIEACLNHAFIFIKELLLSLIYARLLTDLLCFKSSTFWLKYIVFQFFMSPVQVDYTPYLYSPYYALGAQKIPQTGQA